MACFILLVLFQLKTCFGRERPINCSDGVMLHINPGWYSELMDPALKVSSTRTKATDDREKIDHLAIVEAPNDGVPMPSRCREQSQFSHVEPRNAPCFGRCI